MKKHLLIFIESLFLIALLGLDRGVKLWSENYLKTNGSVVLIPGVFQFTYARNVGAAFSILENQQWFFILIAGVISCLLIYVLFKVIHSQSFSLKGLCEKWLLILIPMVLAGALGNLYDRLRYGYVIDTFDFVLIHYPIFNVADSYIVVAVIVFAVLYLFVKPFGVRLEELLKRPEETKSDESDA